MKNKDTLILNLSGFMIVATFFSLWLAVQFEEAVENVLAYILVLSFGILHGANDLKLIQHSKSVGFVRKRFLKTLFYYVLFVFGSAALFYLIPFLTLVLFILFSGYHFGEQHWAAQIKETSVYSNMFFFMYGLFILCLLFYIHADTVTVIIAKITEVNITHDIYFFTTIFSGVSALALYVLTTKVNPSLRTSFLKELFYIIVFFVVFSAASLLWSFAIYFVVWHSIPSLVDQIGYLHGHISKKTIKSYIKSSFPYWIISVAGISVLLYVFRDNYETSLSFFFSFLAAITFPHVLVINRIKNA